MPARRPATTPTPKPPSVADSATLLRHDLEAHKEELRTQNEKLMATVQELEEIRDHYAELYDSAPVGYLTLDRNGVIVEMNLVAAELFGGSRASLLVTLLLPVLAAGDRPRLSAYLQECARGTDDVATGAEMTFKTRHGQRQIRLTCRVRRRTGPADVEFFLALQDVTERRRLEQAREEAQKAHADLVRRMLSIQETERHRIAQDIHDDLGQQITALRLRLEWLAAALAPHPALRDALVPVQDSARKIDQQVDYLLKDLRPVGLDELGLVAVLRKMVEEWGATFGVNARVRTSGVDGLRLSREVETHTYRIVQEALNNVHKHAAARRVDVAFEQRSGRVVLCVEDDGVGLPLPTAGSSGVADTRRGLGLLGMRERAAVIGGELEISRGRFGGTKVTLVLPDPGPSRV